MNYNLLLDVVSELSYRLAMNGAETYRIEESVNRVMTSYKITAEVFAIPNCLHISMDTPDGLAMTRMRRIGLHGNNLDAVEKYSNLSRRICKECPDPQIAMQWLKEAEAATRSYSLPLYLLGNFLGASGFTVLFGGSLTDCLCSGLCGILIGILSRFMDNQKTNPFFKTISTSFLMALLAYFTGFLGIAKNTDTVIIGALMILLPGLVFTNALRDIIYGDTNSGINRIVHVFLIAAAIVLGTGAAWSVSGTIGIIPATKPAIYHTYWVEAIASFIGCCGFIFLFNIHGKGSLLCAIGGILTWLTYCYVLKFTGDDITAYFWATIIASLYSEVIARIRKYPAISYLVVSVFPLIPGAGVYYTMQYVVKGDMENFANQGLHTIAIAGVMAVGILLASTIVRLVNDWILKHANKSSRE